MAWDIEYTNEFDDWWEQLNDSEQNDIVAVVNLLEEKGTSLGYPHSSGINGSKYPKMRELRVQSNGNPIRIFYCFDPRRTAILLIGGDKTGNNRFYEEYIPIADRLYETYLDELRQEGLL